MCCTIHSGTSWLLSKLQCTHIYAVNTHKQSDRVQLVHIYNWYLRRVQCRCGLSKRDDAACFQETGARVYMIRC
jgi:hypothetical protein